MCEGIFSVYVIIKFKIQRILDAFIYSKYPDQRKHVTTESGSADLAGGEKYKSTRRVLTFERQSMVPVSQTLTRDWCSITPPRYST